MLQHKPSLIRGLQGTLASSFRCSNSPGNAVTLKDPNSTRKTAGPRPSESLLPHTDALPQLSSQGGNHLWMAEHIPAINWHTSEILKWGEECFQSCLTSIKKIPSSSSSRFVKPTPIQLNSTSVESPEVSSKIQIPVVPG